MTIGNHAHSSVGNQQYTQLHHDFRQHIPHGQLDDKNSANIHLPFSRNEVDFRDKRNYPTIKEIAGFDHQFDYKKQPLTQVNPSVAVFNDLYNYNPTQGITYFDPHATDKLIHHPQSRPRFESENYYDVSIPKKIEAMTQDKTDLFTSFPNQSLTLSRKYRT